MKNKDTSVFWQTYLFLLLVFLASGALYGQMVTGTIIGTITDETGGILPGAAVTVTNLQTNQSRSMVTDEAGNYIAANLPIGVYQVSAELSGFKKQVRSGISLDVDQRLRVDLTLSVGEITEVVEVEAEAPLVRSETSDLGEVIGKRQVDELPLNGRNFVQLVTLTTGTGTGIPGQSLHGNSPSAFRSDTAVSVNSGRADQNNFLLDGVDNNEADVNTIVIIPIIDGIQEFKVLTNTFSAEFGRSSGAIISVQTKSGTNEFHGTAFEFHRNSALDARNFFDPPGKIPKFIQHQFGASIGGPIVRNRTFFFADYQGTRIRQAQTFLMTVPTGKMRNGDFSEIGRPIRNPLTNVPFSGNIIPSSAMDPAAAALIKTYPRPNRPGLTNNFVNNPVLRRRDEQFDVRIDQQFSDRTNLFVRYSFNDTDRFQPSPLTGTTAPAGGDFFTGIVGRLSGAGDASVRAQGVSINFTHLFSPRLISETRFGFSRFRLRNFPEGFGQNLADQFGIPGINISPITTGLPRLQIAGFMGLGPAAFLPDLSAQNTIQVLDNLTLIRGAHTLKFGFDFRRRHRNNFETFNQQGVFIFTPRWTGFSMSDFLTGFPVTTLRTVLHGRFGKRSWELAAYAQDDVAVTRRFKLNLGLRYEIWSPVSEVFDRQANFDTATARMILAGEDQPLGRGLRHFDKVNFGPRFGFAYDLTGAGKTILRGGYGISFLEDGGQVVTLNLTDNFPFAVTQFIGAFLSPINRLSQGLPVPIVPDPNPLNPRGNVKHIDPNYQASYSQMWALNLQHQLAANLLLDISYAGSQAVKLRSGRNINQAIPGPGPVEPRRPFFRLNPALGTVTGTFSDGLSNYHSLQLKVNRRFSRGLTFLSSYTWSKAISYNEGALGLCADAGVQNPRDWKADRSPACTDIPHRFVFSYSYELPFGKGLSGVGKAVAQGWQINGITVIRSGSPFTPQLTTPSPVTGGTTRPDRICDGALPEGQRSIQRWFDLGCFAPPSNVFGNSGRNILRGPGQINFDFSLFKNFALNERSTVQFRAEIFNLFNTPQFQLPVRFVDTPDAATIVETVNTSRQIQFALKVIF